MANRTTAKSTTVEYETTACVHCGDEVFVDDEAENVDGLPEGVTVAVGGGDHLAAEATPLGARGKSYRVPRVTVKWFGGDGDGAMLETQHMCPSCAEAVYGFRAGE